MIDTRKSRKLIFVIEDDVLIRTDLVEILVEEGYQVQGLKNGWEALKILQANNELPDLILLDLMMPVMDGWSFRNELAKHEKLCEIPVVVVTADGHARDRAKAGFASRLILNLFWE